MGRRFLAGAFCGFALAAQAHAQEVQILRENNAQMARPADSSEQVKILAEQRESGPPRITAEQMRQAGFLAAQRLRDQARIEDRQVRVPESLSSQPTNSDIQTAFINLADGFDFPIGKPDARGYYKARGFHSGGHLGEDWDGIRGGDTDLGDPICNIGDGVVVFARDCHMGWGNVVIIRHAYREDGVVKNIDSLYGHLDRILVRRGDKVARGQKIGTMGNAHGLYDAHLHLEIRKNLTIGMSRAAFAPDDSNYYDPSQFILSHRQLRATAGTYRIAMNTFSRDANIRWDQARNFSRAQTGGGSSESTAALKKAVASQH